jgi:hypothetical protein
MTQLHGRERELVLVREFMTRPEERGVPASRRTPVLVVHRAAGIGPALRYAPELLLHGLKASRWTNKLLLGKGIDHYGSTRDAALSELIRLRRLAMGNDAEPRREATEVLWDAFRTDLRDAFAARRWSLNCVIMLDNIDSPQGRVVYTAHLVDIPAVRGDWARECRRSTGRPRTSSSATAADCRTTSWCWRREAVRGR